MFTIGKNWEKQMTDNRHRIIEFYEKSSGKTPVKDYLDELPLKVRKKILFVFSLIEELQIVPSKYWQKMTGSDGLWEARIEYESNIYRFLGFMHKGKLVILTNGFQKKSQKTPQNEIEIAENYKNDYLSRR